LFFLAIPKKGKWRPVPYIGGDDFHNKKIETNCKYIKDEYEFYFLVNLNPFSL